MASDLLELHRSLGYMAGEQAPADALDEFWRAVSERAWQQWQQRKAQPAR